MADYTEIAFEGWDGVRLSARDYAHADPRGTVLCLHGILGNARNFDGVADRLAEHDRVVVPDGRGRGRSAYRPEAEGFLQTHDVRDVFGLLATLGLRNVVLLGTSLGGLTGLIVAAIATGRDLGPEIAALRQTLPEGPGDPFRGLILNDVGPELGPAAMPTAEELARMAEPVSSWDDATRRLRASGAASFPDYEEADWQRLARELYEEDDRGVPTRFCHPALLPTPPEPGEAPTLPPPPPPMWPLFDAIAELPVLVLRGELSGTLTSDCVERMRRRRPDLHAATIARVGHCPSLREPAAVAAIDEFLAGLDGLASDDA